METETTAQKPTNHWHVRTFNALTAYPDLKYDSDFVDSTDSLFRNMAVRVAYKTLIGVVTEAALSMSIILVTRANACMKFVIEYHQHRLKGERRWSREPHVLKTSYNELLPVATASLQPLGRKCPGIALSTAGDENL